MNLTNCIAGACVRHSIRLRLGFVGAWGLGIVSCLLSAELQAQLPQARLQSIYPAGGQRGRTVEITQAVGTDLDKATQLLFSRSGFQVRQKTQVVNGQTVPVYGVWQVTISPDMPLGIYDVRVGGALGLSNPRGFAVGDFPEVREAEPNNSREKSNALAVDQTANGRLESAVDLDWYKFSGQAGQRILVECQAQRLDSKMNAVVELYQEQLHGLRRIGVSRNEFRGEPLLDVVLPSTGAYFLKVFDFVYAGGPDYVYRLTVHTRPQVEFIVPVAGLPGSTGEYTIYGRNFPHGEPSGLKLRGIELHKAKVQISIPRDPPSAPWSEPVKSAAASTRSFAWSWESPAGAVQPVMLSLANSPTAIEIEPNDAPAPAQPVALPVDITGSFQSLGDVDRFQFQAKKGDILQIEVLGERIGTLVDPVLLIERVRMQKNGEESVQRVAQQDDDSQSIGGIYFDTAADDPRYRLVVNEDATYRVTVSDRYGENRGDATLQYRLSIRKEQPDFQLVALAPMPVKDQNQSSNPWELGLRRGDGAVLQVIAFRRDEFNEPITLRVEGLPTGVTCSGGVIPAGQNTSVLLLQSTLDAPPWFGSIEVVGQAGDRTRQARGGTVLLNSGQGRRKRTVSRVAQTLALALLDEPAPYTARTPVTAVTARQNQYLLLPVEVQRRLGFDANVELEAVVPPSGVTVANQTIAKGATQGVLALALTNNVALKSYVVPLRANAAVNYRYHLADLEQAQRIKSEADKRLQESTQAAKQAEAALQAADQRFKAAKTALEKGQQRLQQTQTSFKNAVQGEKDSQAALAAATLLVSRLDADLAAAAAAHRQAEQLASEAAQRVEVLRQKIAKRRDSSKDKESKNSDKKQSPEDLADEKTLAALQLAEASARGNIAAAATRVQSARKGREAAMASRDTALKQHEASHKAVAALKQALQEEEGGLPALQKEVEATTQARQTPHEAHQAAQAKLTAAKEQQSQAERRAQAATSAARTQQVAAAIPFGVLQLTVQQAVARVTVEGGGKFSVAPGKSLTVPVRIDRLNGFKGPLTVSLLLPPTVLGLTAKPVEIPAEKSKATLQIEVSSAAKGGRVDLALVRAAGDFNGPAAADAPLDLTLAP